MTDLAMSQVGQSNVARSHGKRHHKCTHPASNSPRTTEQIGGQMLSFREIQDLMKPGTSVLLTQKKDDQEQTVLITREPEQAQQAEFIDQALSEDSNCNSSCDDGADTCKFGSLTSRCGSQNPQDLNDKIEQLTNQRVECLPGLGVKGQGSTETADNESCAIPGGGGNSGIGAAFNNNESCVGTSTKNGNDIAIAIINEVQDGKINAEKAHKIALNELKKGEIDPQQFTAIEVVLNEVKTQSANASQSADNSNGLQVTQPQIDLINKIKQQFGDNVEFGQDGNGNILARNKTNPEHVLVIDANGNYKEVQVPVTSTALAQQQPEIPQAQQDAIEKYGNGLIPHITEDGTLETSIGLGSVAQKTRINPDGTTERLTTEDRGFWRRLGDAIGGAAEMLGGATLLLTGTTKPLKEAWDRLCSAFNQDSKQATFEHIDPNGNVTQDSSYSVESAIDNVESQVTPQKWLPKQ